MPKNVVGWSLEPLKYKQNCFSHGGDIDPHPPFSLHIIEIVWLRIRDPSFKLAKYMTYSNISK